MESSKSTASGPAREFIEAWDQRLDAWVKHGESALASGQAIPFDRSDSPRPLAVHLALAGGLAGQVSVEAAGLAPALTDLLEARDPSFREPDFQGGVAVGEQALDRLTTMLAGIDAYRQHPWRRPASRERVIWSAGATRLTESLPTTGGHPVLVIPPLVNRAWILDLLPERSLLAGLRRSGYRPLLLDWGEPGIDETGFSIADYVEKRLLPAAEIATAEGPAPVLGYCMGGMLAMALAVLRPDCVARLALVATPWDFAAPRGAAGALRDLAHACGVERIESGIDAMSHLCGGVPAQFLQYVFALLEPQMAQRKFAAFAALPSESLKARLFVAIEDWLNDGVPLAGRVGVELLVGWCLRNETLRERWRVGGEAVTPGRVRVPTLVVSSSTDRIAPAESVAPLAAGIAGARALELEAGHVGMMVGRRAEATLWQPLAEWFAGPV